MIRSPTKRMRSLSHLNLMRKKNPVFHFLFCLLVVHWKIIENKYALRSITKKDLKLPEKPKLKCLGFTYNGAKLINMLLI